MWELDYKDSWVSKNWCFWTLVLEKTLENPLDCKEIKPVHPKRSHSWIFIGRSDAEAKTPILRPPDAKSWLIGKDPDAGNDWRQEEKGTTEDEMGGWLHGLSKLWELVKDREAWRAAMGYQRVGYDWVTELNWGQNLDAVLGLFSFFFSKGGESFYKCPASRDTLSCNLVGA